MIQPAKYSFKLLAMIIPVAGLILLLTPFFNHTALALESDRKEKISIEADTAELDRNKKTSLFKGNVKIVQGTTRINGDTLELFFDDQQHIEKAHVSGKPAHYQTQPEPGKAIFHATADTIRYNVATDTVELIGNAIARQGDNQLQGAHLRYQIKKQALISAKVPGSRTTIVLDPNTTAELHTPKSTKQ